MCIRSVFIALCLCCAGPVSAAEQLILDLDLEADLLSLSHNIEGFLFPPTSNRSPFREGDLNAAFTGDALRNHLAATALVRIDGEIAGFATEQEVITGTPDSGHPAAESAWLILLNRPGLRGFLAVKQREDASGVFGLAGRVAQEPDRRWPDEWQRFLSTSGEARVQMATGDLAPYQGGLFQEYNYLNPADLKRFNRFRAKIQFVVLPAAGPD